MRRSVASNMARGSALSLAKLVTGLFRIKLVALAIGVAGVGGFTLVSQIALAGVTLVGMSMAVPIINLGRPALASGDIAEAGAIAGTGLAVIALNSVIALLLLIAGGRWLLPVMGIDDLSPFTLPAIAVAITIGALASGFCEGMTFLADRFDLYVRAGIASAVLDVVTFGIGTWAFGLDGAVVALALSPIGLLAAYLVGLSSDPTARQLFANLRVQLRRLPALLTYSGLMLGTAAATNVGLTLLRTHVLVEAGRVDNGYLQTATALATYLLTFVTNGVWGHLHPIAAADGDTAMVRTELRATVRLATLMAFAACGGTALLAPVLIPLFYARDFAAAAPLLRLYMAGEFAFQLYAVLLAYQLTIRQRRRYALLSSLYLLPLLVTGWPLISRFGAFGYAWAHIAASVTALVASAALSWREGQLRWPTIVAILLAYALLAAILTADALINAWEMKLLLLLPIALAGGILARELLRLRQGGANTPASTSGAGRA